MFSQLRQLRSDGGHRPGRDFDFVLIDSEHGPTGVLDNRGAGPGGGVLRTVPIRVPNSSSDTILKMLTSEPRHLVPRGSAPPRRPAGWPDRPLLSPGQPGRGQHPASDYGFTPLTDYFARPTGATWRPSSASGRGRNLDAIAATGGHRPALCGGPMTCPLLLVGAPGQVGYESIRDTVDAVLDAARRHGKAGRHLHERPR